MSADELTESSTLPPYPEMILSAIEARDDGAEGCSKSWISSYIESKYADRLPDAHPSLLEEHLRRMTDGGELVAADGGGGRYARPSAPAKRGRGRPPKPKPEVPPRAALLLPRPRGRPPKHRNPLAPAAAGVSGGKPRGRPPKKPRTDPQEEESPATAAAAAVDTTAAVAATPPSGVKRGRGRPPKVKPQVAEVGCA